MTTRTLSYLKALREALQEELRRDERTFLMGEDVQTGVYGSSAGLVDEFGPTRIRNTPISESAMVGIAIGAAMTGMRPIVDFTIASFVYVAMDQLVSQAAKSRFMFGGQTTIPLVCRAAMFYGGSNAAQHSDRPYPLFMAVPGFKVIVPATPADAKGLLKSAIRDDNVVMCFEDSTLWFSKGEVPEDDYLVPLGKAEVKRVGTDVTLVSVSGALPHAVAAAEAVSSEGIATELIDIRTLVPLDRDTVLGSVSKTGRLVIADPAHRVCSAASEIAAVVAEEAFGELRAPIVRVTTPQFHIPFSRPLESAMYPSADSIAAALRSVCAS